MRANTNTLTLENYAAYETVAAVENAARNAVKATGKAGLFVAAPFIGLGFVVALPLIGVCALAWLAARALVAHWKGLARILTRVGLFVAAPFIGLAYALALPFVGFGAIVWLAVRRAP
jgi:hypothetical protein